MPKIHFLGSEPDGPLVHDETAPGFAALMLELADEVNEADERIWREVERLAVSGDCAAILRLARRRRDEPPVEIAADLDSKRPRRR